MKMFSSEQIQCSWKKCWWIYILLHLMCNPLGSIQKVMAFQFLGIGTQRFSPEPRIFKLWLLGSCVHTFPSQAGHVHNSPAWTGEQRGGRVPARCAVHWEQPPPELAGGSGRVSHGQVENEEEVGHSPLYHLVWLWWDVGDFEMPSSQMIPQVPWDFRASIAEGLGEN